ncbi:MAG: SprT family zinc-dependent metalloprotease [Pseudomonadota bacterium]
MDYVLKKSKRKSVQLRVERDGTLTVRAPLKMKQDFIDAFIAEKSHWIRKHQKTAKERLALQKDFFYILGKPYKKTIQPSLRNFVHLMDEMIIIESTSMHNTEALLNNFFDAQAEDYLQERFLHLEKHAKQLGLETSHPVAFKHYRSRWASCSYDGKITLNYRLYKLAPHLIDHVIMHEFCHLKHMNHSKEFYKLLTLFDPNTKDHNTQMRDFTL